MRSTPINVHFLYGQYMSAWITAAAYTDNWCWTSAGNHFFCRKQAQKTSVSWRINSSLHPPITVIVTGRRPSFMKMACQSFFFPSYPTHTDDKKNTHTHIYTHTLPRLRYSSATDQLSCWIPNRTYPINLSHAGIKDWYRGREIRHHNRPTKAECFVTVTADKKGELFEQKPQISFEILNREKTSSPKTLKSSQFFLNSCFFQPKIQTTLH